MGCSYTGSAGGPNVIATLNWAMDAADRASITSASESERSASERMEKLLSIFPLCPSILRLPDSAVLLRVARMGRPDYESRLRKAWRSLTLSFHTLKTLVDALRGCRDKRQVFLHGADPYAASEVRK